MATAQEKLEAIFELVDQASPAGKKILDLLTDLKKTGDSVKPPNLKVADDVAPAADVVKKALLGAAAAAGAFLLAFAAAMAVGIYQFVAFGIAASEGKRRVIAGLENIEGSAEAAAATMNELHEMASRIGEDTDPIDKLYMKLRGVGFGAKEAQEAILATKDVAALFGDEAGDALGEALKKLKGGDTKLDAKELTPIFKKANLPIQELYKTLAEAKHTTVDAIDRMMKAGQISADEGVAAILQTVSRITDKDKGLGYIAEQIKGNSIPGQLQQLKNRIGDLFEDMDSGPFFDVLKTVNELLSGNSEQAIALRREILDVFDQIGAAVKLIATPENIKALLDILIAALPVVLALSKALLSGGWDGLTVMIQANVDAFKWFNSMAGNSIDWMKVFYVVGISIAVLLGLLEVALLVCAVAAFIMLLPLLLVIAALAAIGYGIAYVIDHAADLWQSGVNLVQGFWNGIKSKWAEMTQWVSDKASGIVTTVANALGIHSPATKMVPVGKNTWQGFNLGLQQEAANTNAIVEAAASGVVAAAPAAVAVGGGGWGGGGGGTGGDSGEGGRGGGNVYQISIVVQGAKGQSAAESHAQGAAAAEGFLEVLEREGLAHAVGE